MLAKGLSFQIIEEALSTMTDSMTWMVNAGGQPTKRREKMFVTLTINRIDKKIKQNKPGKVKFQNGSTVWTRENYAYDCYPKA